nr:hypothetical protein [Micromonospora sp. DSM 115978]
MPDQAGLISVFVGVALAASVSLILRRWSDHRKMREFRRTKELAIDVIRHSETLLEIVSRPAPSGARSFAFSPNGDRRCRVALRELPAHAPAPILLAALSELEQARMQVLAAGAAHDKDLLAASSRRLGEAIEAFATASSIMVRLGPTSADSGEDSI